MIFLYHLMLLIATIEHEGEISHQKFSEIEFQDYSNQLQRTSFVLCNTGEISKSYPICDSNNKMNFYRL